MQTTIKKSSNTKPKIEKQTKDDATKIPTDEKLKKSSFTISTPRNFIQKSTTADIYGQKKRTTVQSAKAPKKSPSTSHLTSNASPMKDLLKSSPSSTSQISIKSERPRMALSKKNDAKALKLSATPRKDFNVTVNSPIVKRKLNMDLEREKSFIVEVPKEKKDKARERNFITEVANEKKSKERERSFIKEVSKEKKGKEKSFIKEAAKEKRGKESDKVSSKESSQRQRTKTRTLDENEVKVLTTEVVDNNLEMFNLSRNLGAKPKAFYIDLDDEKPSQSRKVGNVF